MSKNSGSTEFEIGFMNIWELNIHKNGISSQMRKDNSFNKHC